MNAQVNGFLGAVMLLTRVPVGALYRHRTESEAHAVVYFPLVGALVGFAGGLAAWLASLLLPLPAAILISMLVTVAITGGFHEDGLADAADGLFGGHSPTRRLEIMKDSRLGSYGAIAIWFSLTLKFVLLQELMRRAGTAGLVGALVVAQTLGRGATVVLLQCLPYARSEPSKSKPFTLRLTGAELAGAAVLPVAVPFLLPGFDGLRCLVAAAAATFVAGCCCKRLIDGITGDCLGGTNQLVELACLSAVLIRVD